MKVGDFINENKKLVCALIKVGVISPTMLERAETYAKVKDEYCKTRKMDLSVTKVAEDKKVSEATVWRACREMKQEITLPAA